MKLLFRIYIILIFSSVAFAQDTKKSSSNKSSQKANATPQTESVAKSKLPAKPKAKKSEFFAFEAFLDVEGQAPTSVFNYDDKTIANKKHVIENWKSCKKIPNPKNANEEICENAVGWMPRDADITVIKDKIVRPTIDVFTGEKVKEEFYKIRFAYCTVPKLVVNNVQVCPNDKIKSGEGYVEAAILSRVQRKEFFPTEVKKEPDPLATKIQDIVTTGRMNDVSITRTADTISEFVGECTMQNAESISRLGAEVPNTFDHFVLPKLKYKMNNLSNDEKKKFSELKDEEGKSVTTDKIIDIEALARTMYAEMGRCYKRGLHYPMAVARIVANRSEATCSLKNAIFIQGQHAAGKSDLTKAATSPRQFNLWMKSEGKRKNGPLLQALCPPKSSKERFYTGAYPESPELALWKNSVRIATETVLYPERFAKRTEELEARYYYTSGMKQFYKLERVIPKIEGRYLDNDKCMEIWRDVAKDTMCNKGKKSKFDKNNPPPLPLKQGVK